MFCAFVGYLKRGRGCAAGAAEDHMKRSDHASTYVARSHRHAPPRFEVPFNKARFPFLAKTGSESSDSVRNRHQNQENYFFDENTLKSDPQGTLLGSFLDPFGLHFGTFWAPFNEFLRFREGAKKRLKNGAPT